MLPGETILSGANPICCGVELEFEVLSSAAGYYIGTRCPKCGPYSRETGYFRNWEKANHALAAFKSTGVLYLQR